MVADSHSYNGSRAVHIPCFESRDEEIGEMAHQVRTLGPPAEDPGSVPSTHIRRHSHPSLWFQAIQCLLLIPQALH